MVNRTWTMERDRRSITLTFDSHPDISISLDTDNVLSAGLPCDNASARPRKPRLAQV